MGPVQEEPIPIASPPPGPQRGGVWRGLVLVLAMTVGASAALIWELEQQERLQPALSALRRGQVVAFFDELTSGRIGSRWRRATSGWLARNVQAALPAPLRDALGWARPDGQDTMDPDAPIPIPDRHPNAPAGETAPAAPPPAKDIPRPAPLDPYLTDPTHRLDRFFEALADREAGRRPKVRVLYYGTSEIGHDRVTSQIRRMFQERFGDGGKGWVLIDRTWAILDHRDIIWTHEEPNWVSYSIRTGVFKAGHYGLGGVMVESKGPAWAEYRTLPPQEDAASSEQLYYPFPAGTAWSHIEVHYQTYKSGQPFVIEIDEGEAGTRTEIPTKSSKIQDEIFTAKVPDGPHRLRISTDKRNVRLYGAVFERDEGFVLDALMVIGAWGNSIVNFNPEALTRYVSHRDPALVVFGFGAKESLQFPELSAQQTKQFAEGYAQSVERVMASRPESACLIVSPNDQGWARGDRIETRPAIPRLVQAAKEVAAQTGCAFYNLFEAMGGEGTARRWYHSTPRLVSSDYGHLEAAGSVRVGDLLSDFLLEEYEHYIEWKTQRERELLAAGTEFSMEPPPPRLAEQFAQSAARPEALEWTPCGESERQVVDCRDPMAYLRTNERGQPLWSPLVRDLGGAYLGVGGEWNYSLAAQAQSRWMWILTRDPPVYLTHWIVAAVTEAASTAREFVSAFSPAKVEETAAQVEAYLSRHNLSPAVITAATGMLREIRSELHESFRRARRRRPLFPSWGWLQEPEQYGYVRALWAQGRVNVLWGELNATAVAAVAKGAQDLEVPLRVAYLSNWEESWKRYPKPFVEAVQQLPFDDRSVVLRSMAGRRYNAKRGFSKWHYVAHRGPDFQAALLQPRSRRPASFMKERQHLSPYLSWIGEDQPEIHASELAPLLEEADARQAQAP